MESLGLSSSEGYGSYVHVHHSDAESSDELGRATTSTGDAEQHQNFAGASDQDLERHWQAYQNSLHADQFGSSQSSTSGYSLQSGAGPPYATNGQHTHQTQGFEYVHAFEPLQMSTMDAETSGSDHYSQYAAPPGHDGQGPGFTQPLYNFPDAAQPFLTRNPYMQDNNTILALRGPVAGYPVGSRPVEYRQGDRQRHLEQQVDQWMNVLNTSGIQGTTDSSNRAHGSGPMSLNSEWGGSSVDTLCPSGPPSGSLSARTRRDTVPVSYNRQGQGQGSVMPPTYLVLRQQSAQVRSIPSRPTVYGTYRRVSNHAGSRLNVPMSETSSSRPTSPGSSAPSDPLYCRLCSARFTGKYRQGNYGRHRRQKHGAETREYVCGATDCDRVFQRDDARVKHQRRRHPELFQVGA